MSVLTLMYHSIANRPDDLFSVSPGNFAGQLHYLQCIGYRPVSLDQLCAWFDGRLLLPRRSYMLTFDDGYFDMFETAWPIIHQAGATACIFITTDWIGERERKHVRIGSYTYPMLTWAELRALADAGVAVGAHTKTHPDLRKVDQRRLWQEIAGSKRVIEDRLGRTVQAFSYPHSQLDPTVLHYVSRANYAIAFGGRPGINTRSAMRYHLARPCVYNDCRILEFAISVCTGIHLRERFWGWYKGIT